MERKIRITSGKFRGRKISTPGGKTHPMGERERLALFNMISSYVPGAVILDGFAGSGALGFEALSRDAKSVTFVDNYKDAIDTIKTNSKNLGLEGYVKIIKGDVGSVTGLEAFDVVLADPPYDNFVIEKIQHMLQFLKKDGVFALSHPGDAPELQDVELQNSRKYANATISIYVKR